MYEFLILAQLSRRPMHGYMIAKIIGKMSGPFWPVQWGALYPILGRLEQEGYITSEPCPEGEDGRIRKVYAITPAGRKLLHDHLMDTDRHQGDYCTVFAHKVPFFHLLEPEERVRLSRHYAVYAQQHIDHLQRTRHELTEPVSPVTDAQRAEILTVIDHHIDRWTLERSWAEKLLDAQKLVEVS